MSATDQRKVFDARASQEQVANLRRGASGLEEEHEYQPPVDGLVEGGADGEEENQELLKTDQAQGQDEGQGEGNQAASNGSQGNGSKDGSASLEDSTKMPPGPGTLAKTLSCFKILITVVLILYLWMASARSRENALALEQTLAVRGQIPQKDWNEKKQGKDKRTDEVPESVAKFTKGTRYEKIVQGKGGKDSDGNDIARKSSMWGATSEFILSEIGDKSFVLIIIFTLGWTNPTGAKPGYRVAGDGRMEINHRKTHVDPLRIFFLVTVGTAFMDLTMTGKTTPGKEKRWVFTSAIILVYCLLNYAFRLMSAHFAIVTALEAAYENVRSQASDDRIEKIQKWAKNEIQTSRDFNDEHMESVFDAFTQVNTDDPNTLIKSLEGDEASLFREIKNIDASTIQQSGQTDQLAQSNAINASGIDSSVQLAGSKTQEITESEMKEEESQRRKDRMTRANDRKSEMEKNETNWSNFQEKNLKQLNITLDPKKLRQTQLLTEDESIDSNKVIWPKGQYQLSDEFEFYNVLTGDTFWQLWYKIKGQVCKSPEGEDEIGQDLDSSKQPLIGKSQQQQQQEGVEDVTAVIEDVDNLAKQVVGDNIVANIISFILSLLQIILKDLLVTCFFASQELMDSSNIHMMNMKVVYTKSSLVFAIFFGKIILHVLLIAVVYYIAKYGFSVYEGHTTGVIVIFFICAYEFMYNVLFNLSGILGLEPLQSSAIDQ